MTIRTLIGSCCVAAVLCLAASVPGAWGESPLAERGAVRSGSRVDDSKSVKPSAASVNAASSSVLKQMLPETPDYLVREVVYNELHDHDTHGYWRYWIERHTSRDTQLEKAVETPDGPVARLELSDGRPIGADKRAEEERRLEHLINSPAEQAQHRKEYLEDDHRIGRILVLLPDAFLYEPAGEEAKSEQMPGCLCYHFRFRPNPSYPAHSIESRIFHAMTGDLWISVDHKRLVRLDGKLQENVDFGYGILGRLYKGGWFRLERTQVSSAMSGGSLNGDWKTERLEVHMIGRAMLFKTIARETSEVRGGFAPVPSSLSLRAAAALVREPIALPSALITQR